MARRLVVCCDGTWNTPEDKSPTNVVRVARAVEPRDSDGNDQVVFYDRGIGTGNFVDRVTGGATGKGLDGNIQEAYRFLVHNYADADELYFFGFSRGAYTVRSLVGLIRNCGLLRKEYAAKIPEAFEIYRSDAKENEPDAHVAIQFKASHSRRETSIRFLGAWDTVGALGIPLTGRKKSKYSFHDTTLSSIVENAYHALAIDERRRPFRPTIWETKAERQNTAQVWFAGVHSDVGGGYNEGWGLSDITLTWMLDRAHQCGLRVDPSILSKTYDPSDVYTIHDSTKIGRGAPRKNILKQRDEAVHLSVRDGIDHHGYAPRNLPAEWRNRLATWRGQLFQEYCEESN